MQIQFHPWVAKYSSKTLWFLLSGVDLFFVLSGFLVGGILLDSKNKPNFFKIFWIKRVTRIFPVAYLMLATYALAIFITNHFHITRFDNWLLAEYRPPIWTFATFMQSFPIAMHGYGGPRWMAMSWSLAIEDQFYLLFPLAVYFMPRKKLVTLVIACIVIAPILRDVFQRIFIDWYASYVLLLPSRADGIMYGVALALILRNKMAFSFVIRYRLLLDMVALLMFYLIINGWTCTLWPAPKGGPLFPLKQSIMSIMWAIVILRVYTYQRSTFNMIWRNGFLAKIGLISYGTYMFHQTINGLVHGILFNQEPIILTMTHLLAAIAVILISLGLATLSYVFLEKPIQLYGRELVNRISREKLFIPNKASLT